MDIAIAVIHISEAEAAIDYESVLNRARTGQDVVIDGMTPVRITREPLAAFGKPMFTEPRLLSEVIADLESRASTATLPEGFGDGLEEAVRSHEKETLSEPWDVSGRHHAYTAALRTFSSCG